MFFPEPGCSDPTFTGSGAEVTSLASTMFLTATDQLAGGRTDMTATFVSLSSARTPIASVTLSFRPDFVLEDSFGGYEVRFAASAVAEMHAWVRRSERLAPEPRQAGCCSENETTLCESCGCLTSWDHRPTATRHRTGSYAARQASTKQPQP